MDKNLGPLIVASPRLVVRAPVFQINHGSIKRPDLSETVHLAKNEDIYPIGSNPPPTNSGIFEAFLVIPEPKKNESSSWWVTGILGGGRSNGFSNNRMETSKLFWDMDVSLNGGTPKSSILIGFPL